MNKLEALNYLVDNHNSYDEWSEDGLKHDLCDIIKSGEEKFTKEYLDNLLEKAQNN